MNLALRFLGVGNAQAVALGSACAVIERDGSPLLMIDCGPDALTAFLERYQSAPSALFLTHAHMDHVGGLERLFFKTWFDGERRGKLRVYAHAALIPVLQSRVADYPEVLAEGGANFWDAFQLIPVSRGFWHEGLWFDVFPTRHHAPMTSFGLALRGSVVWTGDTRPLPEALSAVAAAGELVAHDCVLQGNPSHSGVDDIEREYPAALRERLVLYHYGSPEEADALRGRGYRVAERGEGIALANPHAEAVLASRSCG
ncbi:MAG: MBL fold metallo-hydrolase [Dokdonella sp.]|jgi:ribonuclease BN (tRNA processing enzyme)|uniref:MBL fold metallo-hydrolase n=1 Tax=Dokdonella sp. TaxID=2291710 RepID=UPI0025BD40CF|nr:MBL fold metallo-hydrolase [Dokdonella sp.]MBK8122058.1 MBL fold metallo-hydrolase [Dokdonella sp.]HNV07085.1 MBL fold metallo-hydrolase [Dokdonella sp.]HPW02805.1 MBL fold metallo-hydrolase [Dokdonella sp.]HQV49322.1 MBL fold metallo-hydrolase [Dokdonella sp.]